MLIIPEQINPVLGISKSIMQYIVRIIENRGFLGLGELVKIDILILFLYFLENFFTFLIGSDEVLFMVQEFPFLACYLIIV